MILIKAYHLAVILGLSQNRIQYVISRYREIFCHFFSSKKLTKKDLAVNLSTKNVLISLNVLQTLRAKTFLTLHSNIFLT